MAEAEARATEVAHRIEELEREVASRVPAADYHEAKTQIAELRVQAESRQEDLRRLLAEQERVQQQSGLDRRQMALSRHADDGTTSGAAP